MASVFNTCEPASQQTKRRFARKTQPNWPANSDRGVVWFQRRQTSDKSRPIEWINDSKITHTDIARLDLTPIRMDICCSPIDTHFHGNGIGIRAMSWLGMNLCGYYLQVIQIEPNFSADG